VPDELPKQLIAILMGLAIFIVLGFFLRDLTRAQKVRWFMSATAVGLLAITLLIGGIYLLVRKVISWRIPVIYIGTVAVFVFIFGGFDVNYVLCQVCGGGLIFGAFFMATDYVTSPITPMGQVVFGVVLGLLTGIFRLWGASPEGVSYAIILSNLFVPMIERVTLPKAFGKEAKKA